MNTQQQRYRRLVFLTWFLTLDLIMFGAFVRLTDSGLGCPDWPGCYGSVTPIGAMADIHQATQAMPFGPVTVGKAWIEMIHRYVASFLGFLIIAITYMAYRYRKEIGHSPLLAFATLILVCIQGLFGKWTVTLKLMPVIVTGHLVLGLSLLMLLTWLAARERPHSPVASNSRRWTPWMALGILILILQVALGGWVSTNYAVLACMDFPTCHGFWLPDMDFKNAYSFNRALGELSSGELISQSALTAIHWTHRNFAFVVFAYLGSIAWAMRNESGLMGPARLMLALLLAQLITGLSTIYFQWPLLIAVLHNGGAASLALVSVVLMVRLATAGRVPCGSTKNSHHND